MSGLKLLTNSTKGLILVAGGAALCWSLWQLAVEPPNFRFAILIAAAVLVSWPRLNLPAAPYEPLFFLSLLAFGPAPAISLCAVGFLILNRFQLRHTPLRLIRKLSGEIASAASATVTFFFFLNHFESSLVSEGSTAIAFINILAIAATLRALTRFDWPRVLGNLAIQKKNGLFAFKPWFNRFLAAFGASFTAGFAFLVASENNPQIPLLSAVAIIFFYFAYHHFRTRERQRIASLKTQEAELSSLQIRSLDALLAVIDGRDIPRYDRARWMQLFSEGVGRSLGLTDPELYSLRAATLLSDPTSDDWGASASPYSHRVSSNHSAVSLIPAVRHQYEHWDGSGFPDRLRGLEIPVSARILAVASAFEEVFGPSAVQTTREQTIDKLIAESGRRFDPTVVQAFLNYLPTFQADLARIKRSRQRTGTRTSPAPLVTPAEEIYLEALRRARQEGSELLDIAQALSSTLNLEEAVSIIISRLSRHTSFDTYAIYVREGDCLYLAGAIGPHGDQLNTHEAHLGSGIIGASIATGTRAIDVHPGDEFHAVAPEIKETFVSFSVIPLTKGEQSVGAIALLSRTRPSFSGENRRVVDLLVPLAADAVSNALAYRRTETSAVTDALTGLPNSRMLQIAFEEESNRADRYNTGLAMLMIDLDGFKKVNDTFGHLAGDDVLREVARCLKNELRASDKLIRYAGDEFIALLPHANEKSIDDLIARIQNYLESRCHLINGIEVRLGASIGYSIFGRDGKSLDELLRVADEGMYRNKAVRKRQIKPRRRKAASSENAETPAVLSEAIAS